MSHIYVIHENPEWLPPLAEAPNARGLPWADWFMHNGIFDLAAPPPEGVFHNRMSASSHTRDHRFSAELTACVLAWLTRAGIAGTRRCGMGALAFYPGDRLAETQSRAA